MFLFSDGIFLGGRYHFSCESLHVNMLAHFNHISHAAEYFPKEKYQIDLPAVNIHS